MIWFIALLVLIVVGVTALVVTLIRLDTNKEITQSDLTPSDSVEDIHAMLHKIDARTKHSPHVNPCPSREEFNRLRNFVSNRVDSDR